MGETEGRGARTLDGHVGSDLPVTRGDRVERSDLLSKGVDQARHRIASTNQRAIHKDHLAAHVRRRGRGTRGCEIRDKRFKHQAKSRIPAWVIHDERELAANEGFNGLWVDPLRERRVVGALPNKEASRKRRTRPFKA